jgi:hypothetical protein
MPPTTPRLDDRSFEDLVREAKAVIAARCPGWTDLGPSDPGVVLIEAFAHLTEVLLYRLNRLPDKAYVEFLRLIGVQLQPPAAARVELAFALPKPGDRAVDIPRGTRVAARRPAQSPTPPVFVTAAPAQIPAGQLSASVTAYHCELVDAELLGVATAAVGLSLSVKRPPIVARTGETDLVVAVEATAEELQAGAPSLRSGDKTYRIWREVESFAHAEPDPYVYVADRLAGTIRFAPVVSLLDAQGALEAVPSAHLAVPAAGREVRAWYWRGGGPDGNLPAGWLEVLKDPIPGLQVSNPAPAMGGRAAETLANALVRGPEEIHSLRRAVTASDFETLARHAGGISRAHAVTQAQVWRHAPPGTVEVLLVPELPAGVRGEDDAGATADALRQYQTEEARARIQADLEVRRPVGTRCVVSWARYKKVAIKASLLAHRAADPAALRARLLSRLYRYVDPLPSGDAPGWGFGEPLPSSTVYYLLQSEPSVLRVDQLELILEEVPSAGRALAADFFQPSTWYAANGEMLYRSSNDGEGWELVGRFTGETLDQIEPHPSRPGLVGVSARLPAAGPDAQSRLHFTWDCGETWDSATYVLPAVEDMTWTVRDDVPVLLLATDKGLFELALRDKATPLPIAVDPGRPGMSFWAVASAVDARGNWVIAAAAQGSLGVYVSDQGGARSFRLSGLKDQDVRILEVQQEGSRTFLWAGCAAASGSDPGKGCAVIELTGTGDWRFAGTGWDGGSCFGIAFAGPLVFAATHHAGVLSLDPSKLDGPWTKPALTVGLPLRERDRLFEPVQALGAFEDWVLAGGPTGVFRRKVDGAAWENCSGQEATRDLLPLPSTWLFCSGQHQIEVKLG